MMGFFYRFPSILLEEDKNYWSVILYDAIDRHFFCSMKELQDDFIELDAANITYKLIQKEHTKESIENYFLELTKNKLPHAAYKVEREAFIVNETREMLRRLCQETLEELKSDACDLNRHEWQYSLIKDMANNKFSKGFNSIKAAAHSSRHQIESLLSPAARQAYTSTGFPNFDQAVGGFYEGELVVIGARPAMGKTAIYLSMMLEMAKTNKTSIGCFTLDTSENQLMTRIISMEAEVSAQKLKKGQLEEYELKQIYDTIDKISELPIYLNDQSLSLDDIRHNVRKMVQQHKVKVVFIDSLQLILSSQNKRNNREQDVSNCMRVLKRLARELNISIIITSQLSRAVETRGGDKKPQLSDLRESGSIEQEADKVIFLHRPEYYGLTEDATGNPTNQMMEVIIAKNRQGPLGSVFMRFIDRLAKVTDNFETQEFNFTAHADSITRNDKMTDIADDKV